MKEMLTPAIVELLLEALAAVVLSFLLWAGNKAIGLYEKVSKTKVSAAQKLQVLATIRASASYADEQAHKYAKGLIASGPATGAEKMVVAKEVARAAEPVLLHPDQVGDQRLEVLIEGELPGLRATTTSIRPAEGILLGSLRPGALPPG